MSDGDSFGFQHIGPYEKRLYTFVLFLYIPLSHLLLFRIDIMSC